jgi:hypothetical protein
MYGLDKDQDNSKRLPFDHYHSHFILVDNHSQGEHGQELQFRLRLESELRKNTSKMFLDDDSISLSCSSRRNSIKSGIDDNSSLNKRETDARRASIEVPMVLVCVNGGYHALRMIDESLKVHLPFLLIEVSI